ncbi:MAG: LysR family transcriptional regulator [Sneathiellales bacterium]|nr:LysR family transcriptional regulator [Sneathiellales bacterium]
MQNWDDIRFFKALTKAQSIRQAAAELKTTHATVSRRLRQLEEDLGGRLFERGLNGLELTAFGQSILDPACKAADQIARIDRLSFAHGDSLAGPLKLSVYEDLFNRILIDPVSRFMELHPEIELTIDTSVHLRDISGREADVIVRITNSPPEPAVGRKLVASPLALYTSEIYLANRPDVDRWIALDYGPSRPPRLNAKTVFLGSTPSVVAEVLKRGHGIGLLPMFIGETEHGLVRMPELPPIPDKDIWALTHSDLTESPRVRHFMDHLYTTFNSQKVFFESAPANQ